MQFKQKKTKSLTHKEWFDENGDYRINWRIEYEGVSVLPMFYACVKCRQFNGGDMWDFVGRRGPYKTFKKANEDCERHKRQWDKFLKIMDGPYKGRTERLDGLDRQIMSTMPWWVLNQCDSKVRKYLLRDDLCRSSPDEDSTFPSDPLPTSKSSGKTSADKSEPKRSSRKMKPAGPVSPATAADASSRSPDKSPRTVGKSRQSLPAKPAAEVNLEPAKRAKRDTTKKSKVGLPAANTIAV